MHKESTIFDGKRKWTISERIKELTGKTPTWEDVIAIEEKMLAAYRAKHGQNPPTRE